MVDACRLQQTQRLPDVFCRSFLAGMGDREEVVLACSLEDVDKLRWWMADFVRIESYSGDVFPLSEEDYRQLQGAMWALRQPKEPLTDEDNDVLVCLFDSSSCLKMAYELCGE